MIRQFAILTIALLLPIAVNAQTSNYDKAREKQEKRYEKARDKANKRYEKARDKANKKYVKALERAWERRERQAPIERPIEKPVPPVVAPIDPEPPIDKPIDVDPTPVMPLPEPEPQPEPISPPQPTVEPLETFSFEWFGTRLEVRRPEDITLADVTPESIAKVWDEMSDGSYEAILEDCLIIRSERNLCDWAYLSMVNELAKAIYGKSTNEAELLAAYLLTQSGYKMRLGTVDGNLHALFACRHIIYEMGYLNYDGDYLYPLNAPNSTSCWQIADAAMHGESSVSLYVNELPQLASRSAGTRHLASKAYPAAAATITADANLMDFYTSYPTSFINNDHLTRWQQYADTPLSAGCQPMVEALRNAIAGKSEQTAVNIILNFVQTAFTYGYDDEVWGGDRAFFPDETVHYPYSDCEDRAILFTRLVRDLTGLNTALLYYPGHLAAAVEFTEQISGDYLIIGSQRFVVCDPTYINARIGMTMPGMDNATAKAILL